MLIKLEKDEWGHHVSPRFPKPHEPCLCASGKKFRKCHGRPCAGCGQVERWWRIRGERYIELPSPGTDGVRNFSVHPRYPSCAPPWYSVDYLLYLCEGPR